MNQLKISITQFCLMLRIDMVKYMFLCRLSFHPCKLLMARTILLILFCSMFQADAHAKSHVLGLGSFVDFLCCSFGPLLFEAIPGDVVIAAYCSKVSLPSFFFGFSQLALLSQTRKTYYQSLK